MVVDVELREPEPALVLAREVGEERLDRLARPAPRRGELDEHRHVGRRTSRRTSRRSVDDHSRPRSAFQRSTGTCRIASTTIPPLIFDSPDPAVDERDRDLDHAEPGPERAVGALDLEPVAARRDRVEIDRLEHPRRKHLKPPVRSRTRDAEHEPRVERAAAGDQTADAGPS